MKKYLIGIALSVACASPSYATSYCHGKVNNVFVDSSGHVIFKGDWLGNYTEACALDGSWNNISASTCSAWFAILESADDKQETVLIEYTGSTYTCSTLPTYGSAPAPGYIMLDQ
jgi:hypothetical protein